MEKITQFVLPLIVGAVVVFGLFKRIKVFNVFLLGAKKGLKTSIDLLPTFIALVMGVSMLRESGALSLITQILEPIARLTNIPVDVLPLAVLSPISGSGSLTMFEQILKNFGPDSLEGRVASIIMGSTETTFYALTVYYGSVGIKKSGCTVPAALLADITNFVVSAMCAVHM